MTIRTVFLIVQIFLPLLSSYQSKPDEKFSNEEIIDNHINNAILRPLETDYITSHFMQNVNKTEVCEKSNTYNNERKKNRKRKSGGKKNKFDQDW